MKRIFTFFVFVSFYTFGIAQLPIISQYYEGSSNNKWIEVNNPTSSTIDISGYYVCNFNSSTSSPTACVQLSGTLAPNNSFLVKNPSATLPAYATADASGGCSFNGNDKVVITTSNTGASSYNDRIDEIGGTPGGSNWGKDKSFYRNPGINTPSTTYSASDWTQKTISEVDNAAVKTFERLGWHNVDQLPITIFTLEAKNINNNTLVTWSTLSEVNNDYFSVEWSTDGLNFEEIAKVAGAGTSRDKREYSFVHKSPKKGVNYYRLTQYDFDGRSKTFNVVSVVFDTKSLDMAIVPNRVENSLRLEFTKPVEEGRLHIYNMEGQKVKSYVLATGVDAFNFDISGFTAGQYIAKFVDSNKTISKRFVKL